MKCPNCTNTNLVMSERQGVEIDYFPECRGVWLDRGELDKIIEKSNQSGVQGPSNTNYNQQQSNYGYKDQKHHHSDHHHKPHKKGSWLSDLFD